MPERGIVGHLLGNSYLTFLANGPVAWVADLMVDRRARRSGIGCLLVEYSDEWAQSIQTTYLALASRRAGPFCRSLDFQNSAVVYKKAFT